LEGGENFFGQSLADSGNFSEVGGGGIFNALDRPEPLEKSALAGRAHAGDGIEEALADAFFQEEAVEAVGGAVGFIADPLEEAERATILGKPHGEGTAGAVDFLEFLRETDDREVREFEALKFLARAGELPAPAIHDHEVG
jgi:hypothetical protein